MKPLYQLSACEVIKKLRKGEVSIHDALDGLQTRIDEVDSKINSLPTLCFEQARHQADRLEKLPPEKRGILCGLPVTIKDLTAVKDVRTTFGSLVYEHHVPAQSDRLVQTIQTNGGVIYAKSNTPEFGTGGITFNDVFGITRSPYNQHCASGGSSGGAAASLASGCAWLSHGSDMAGSLRTPANFCGVTSLRPSPGRIVSDSQDLPYDILPAEGPMARCIEDLAIFADAMGFEIAPSLYSASQTPRLPSRIAISHNLGITQVSDDIGANFQAFIDTLSKTDSTLVESGPALNDVHECFDILRAHAYAIGLEDTLISNPNILKPEVVWNIETGLSLSSIQLRRAKRIQGRIINDARQFMDEIDLLICPATSLTAVNADLRYPGADKGVPIADYYRWLAIAYAVTVTALPVITLPVAITESGMPFAVQLVGKSGGEFALFQHARYIEKLCGWNCAPVDPGESD